MKKYIYTVLFMLSVSSAYGAGDVSNNRIHEINGSRYAVLSGEVKLPSKGVWEIEKQNESTEVTELYIVPPEEATEQFIGHRMAKVIRKNKINQGQHLVSRLSSISRQYAKEYDGVGPTLMLDLKKEKYKHILDWISTYPWDSKQGEDIEGPFVFLIPNVDFKFEGEGYWVKREKREVIALELRPYVDDGKHWVAYTDGTELREEINPKLINQYNLSIRPVLSKDDHEVEDLPDELVYRLIAVRSKKLKNPLPVHLRNTLTDVQLTVDWDVSAAKPIDDSLVKNLNEARQEIWHLYFRSSFSSILQSWMASKGLGSRFTRRRGPTTSVFNVMGGRAAVRETLQMQVLGLVGKDQEHNIPVNTLEGVTVKSHPYEEMLKKGHKEEIPLANVMPADHFFMYVAKPGAMLSFLDDGAEFLSRLGGSITGSNIKYYLKSRYLKRLGLDEEWLSMFLKSGAVKECAIISPDMFFIDGTDITVVSRLIFPKLITPLLKLVGVGDFFRKKPVIERTLKNGKSVFWALRNDLLMVSTSKSELELVLDLEESGGKNSLGKSAEFRYMLTQLPVNDQTRLYAYFSDPFIRRLVGPATKISQVRRITAKAQMENITAAALLANLDGIENPSSLENLVAHSYLAESYLNKGYSLNKDLVVSSNTYGTLSNMTMLSDVPVDNVSQGEANAYKSYVENYTRFWRQFFDPIAIRLDDKADGSLDATTFILPLLDSSIYNGLKGVLTNQESGAPMKVPYFSPDPVLNISLNLKEESWIKITEDFSDIFRKYTQISPVILDDLGPSIHFAIHDADPVIVLGSGDLIGAFGGDIMRIGRGNEMLVIPMVLSLLTRPCTLVVETRNPEKTLGYLKLAATMGQKDGRDDELNVKYYKVHGKDSWVYSLDIFGFIKIRFGLDVKDGYLMIRNIPWSSKENVVRVENSDLNGARIEVYPTASKLQLPGLHATASEYQGLAAMNGAGLLYPLLVSGYTSMTNASEAHMKMFGFTTLHPEGGQWIWDNQQITSDNYGSVRRREQPLHIEGDDNFGLMKSIQKLSIEMQFEHTGLRTKLNWKTR